MARNSFTTDNDGITDLLASNYPLHAWGGDTLLNTVFGMYYRQNPSFFNLSQIVSELQVEFTGTTEQAPTIQLGPLDKNQVVEMFNIAHGFSEGHPDFVNAETLGQTPPNFSLTIEKITVSIYDYSNGKRGALLAQDDFEIVSYGIFGIENQKIVLNSLTSKVNGGTDGDKPLVQKIINGYVLPSITKRVQSITLPQFQRVFGTDLNASISSVDVSDQVFHIYASVAPAHLPETSGLPFAVHSGDGNLHAFVSNVAVKALANTMLKPLHSDFHKTTGGSFSGAGIKGRISMSKPSVNISGSSASASAGISIHLQGGIKAFGVWAWVPLPVPDTDVIIDIKLGKSGEKAYIEITGVQKIHVNLGHWPSILNPVKDAIEGLLDAIVSAFRGTISSAVSGIRLELFSLPHEIPGMNVPANLTFAQLEFASSGAQTAIQITPK